MKVGAYCVYQYSHCVGTITKESVMAKSFLFSGCVVLVKKAVELDENNKLTIGFPNSSTVEVEGYNECLDRLMDLQVRGYISSEERRKVEFYLTA